MRMNLMGAKLALAGGAFLAITAAPAKAADTLVTCDTPIATVNTGQDGTPPRFTIQCTGGSSAGPIVFFAYKIETNPNVAQLLSRAFETFVLQHARGSAVTLSSNLSDTSGAAWGCGAGNCRILDYFPDN
jgi:hypothetical protein